MTALGKTLVFFNLLFALVTGGLIVMVFLTRTNWRVGMEAAQAETKAAQATARAEAEARKNLAEKYTNEIKQLNEQIAKLKQDVAAKDAEISNQKNQAELARKEAAESLTVSQGATREIAKLQQERNQLADLLAKTKDDLAKVTKDLADMSAKETYARLRADALEKDYVALKEDHAALRRKYEQAQAELVRNGVRSRGAQENPPRLPTVETTGRVTEVSGQFASVSLGSDNGIEKGHILQVYRLGRGINDALYLGTLTITNVRPHEAVGVFEPSARGRTVSVNDTVDTKISH